jgi:hypothetical protein
VKMFYVLVAALATGAAVGGARSLAGSPPSPAAEGAPSAAVAADAPATAPGGPIDALFAPAAPAASEALEGEVLEVIEVPSYTYLRIGEKGAAGTWAAVSTAPVAVGDRARIADAMRMTGFTSTALKRTFPVIYFGTLSAGRPAPAAMAGAGADPHARGTDPHAGSTSASTVEVKRVDRAAGPGGKTVAETIAQRTALAGKTVRIRATVVKATPGVLGRTYLHLRDGSGDAAAGTHDIAVTTAATPSVGDVVVVEGVVAIDRDIGAGYKFPTIVEDAQILTTP